MVATTEEAATVADTASRIERAGGTATVLRKDVTYGEGDDAEEQIPGASLLAALTINDDARPLVEALLGRIRIVGDVREAIAAQKEHPGYTFVTRDGASAGVTPALLPDVPPGHHTFVFELAGHRPQTLETDLAAPAPVRLFARLVSTSASLHVTSEPAGASVSLNGAPRGATPLDLAGIPEGEATLELSLPGHAPFRTQVRLAAGERFSVNAPLDPLPGRLSVVTLPAGARVYVDNQYRGESPFVLEEAAPREYRVRVELAGHDPAARTVAIGPGEERTEEFRLAANVGSVSVSTSPAGVDVLVDGVRRGTTAAKDGAAVSAPLVLADVPAGHHRLTFSRPGYAEASAEVDVARNVTATVPTVELRRRFLPDVVLRTRNGGEIRGVFVEQTKEFYRLETSPGITRSIPLDDIVDWKPLDSTSEAPSK